ncbi:MAG: hypothetical protein IPJ46_16820 [Anaerolineales bacterium]|nr:hypothetical protein [Anaerolineales bacterium]
MPLITLFSAPKPFTNPHIAIIQRNAIKSWTLLPDVEVILFGEEEGLPEAARELGVKHIAQVSRSVTGVPLISSMVQLARENGSSDLLCIINSDMILMPDFLEAAKQAVKWNDKFVLLSQRWDYDIPAVLDFAEGWASRLSESVRKQNQLHRPAGSDFFLFPRDCYQDIPNFTIGRAGWDNWMIYQARMQNWPVIDCTPSVMIIHQNHDYSHLPFRYTILDATHQLAQGGKLVRPKMTSLRFTRRFELFLRSIFSFLPEKTLENIVRPKRWKKRFKKLFK